MAVIGKANPLLSVQRAFQLARAGTQAAFGRGPLAPAAPAPAPAPARDDLITNQRVRYWHNDATRQYNVASATVPTRSPGWYATDAPITPPEPVKRVEAPPPILLAPEPLKEAAKPHLDVVVAPVNGGTRTTTVTTMEGVASEVPVTQVTASAPAPIVPAGAAAPAAPAAPANGKGGGVPVVVWVGGGIAVLVLAALVWYMTRQGGES